MSLAEKKSFTGLSPSIFSGNDEISWSPIIVGDGEVSSFSLSSTKVHSSAFMYSTFPNNNRTFDGSLGKFPGKDLNAPTRNDPLVSYNRKLATAVTVGESVLFPILYQFKPLDVKEWLAIRRQRLYHFLQNHHTILVRCHLPSGFLDSY